ncbi:MAG: beta-CASP ribonuclease aCPSF1 [Candidatus Thermoplasmatota archaeon]|nr:beta-CASP ribonuclease aCPSF1 [Candidatus Thermoplasmatota archaeon]
MSVEDILEDAKEAVREVVSRNVRITDIQFEGSVIVIYTKDIGEFTKDSNTMKKLAEKLKRRVLVRPDPSLLADPEEAEEEIREIVPEEAEITDMEFKEDIGQITIEAKAPGIAIGKDGKLLNEIKRETKWAVDVIRTPPIKSKTIDDIRGYLKKVRKERKDFLHKVGRKINRDTRNGETFGRVTALGGYREVGRSAHLLQTRDSKVLIDCGVDVSARSENGEGTPYLNAPELMPLEDIDCLILTHAHLDHSGIIPALYKYGYEGPIYTTAPTRDLAALLQLDYIKVSVSDARDPPYKSEHIREQVKRTIPLEYGETTDIAPDMRLTLHNAGHILGSSVAHIHIGDGDYNVAFTGDIKYDETWLFNQAHNNFPRVETVVMESTYGGYEDLQPSRNDAVEQLKDILDRALNNRNGKVILPVFAVGRSQEVMLVIEEAIRKGELPETDVYLDGMIWEATAIHTAYPEYLNNVLKNKIFHEDENPFLSDMFEEVGSMDKRKKICDRDEPAIVLATAGMMNGGPVLEYFKAWGDDPEATLIFVGYQAQGTLGSKIQRDYDKITLTEKGEKIDIPVKLNVSTCEGFSGHSDRIQLLHYISKMNPNPNRVLTSHGEESKATNLASTIYKKYGISTRAPKNLETIRLY